MEKKTQKDRIVFGFVLFNFALMIMSCIRNVIFHYRGLPPVLFCDHFWLYEECKYTLQGLFIGDITDLAASWPWTRFLGIFVHGSFLTQDMSVIYSFVIYTTVIITTIIFVCDNLKVRTLLDKLTIVFILLSSWYYVYLVCALNNGSLVCLLLILLLTLVDKHPYYAGIVLAFALVKAQLVVPIFLIFLLRKKWKTIITSICIVISSWITYSIMTSSTPWKQLYHLLFSVSSRGDNSYWRFGMFDFILLFDNSKSMIVLPLSVIGGLSILIFIERKVITDKIKNDYIFLSYFHAAICTLLWFYTTKCDYLILTIVALGAFEVWKTSKKTYKEMLCLFFVFCCTLMNPTNILSQILAKLKIIPSAMAQPLEGRFDTILLIVLLVFFAHLINQNRTK